MNINKGIRGLAGFVLVFYFVSMVAGPSYGTKGTNNGVEYEITISDMGVTDVMTRGGIYSVSVICKYNRKTVPELNMSLPTGFELIRSYVEKISWPWGDNWGHAFVVKSPSVAGVYQIAFTGKDVSSESFNFEAPIRVVENYGDYVAEKDAKNALPPAFPLIGILIVTLAIVGQFIFK